jgi:hypothetical protein
MRCNPRQPAGDRVVLAAVEDVEPDLELAQRRPLELVGRVRQQRLVQRPPGRELAEQVQRLHLRPRQREGQRRRLAPPALAQRRRPGPRVAGGRRHRRRRERALGRREVARRQLASLARVGHQRRAEVQVMDHLEVPGVAAGQRAADRQVQRLRARGRQLGLRRLLHALVQELIPALDRDHQPPLLRLAQRRRGLVRALLQQRRQQPQLAAQAHARRRADRRPGRRRQLAQPVRQQRPEVVRQLRLRGLLRPPLPHPELAAEAQRPLLVQGLREQAQQERVARAARVGQVDQRREVLRTRVQRLGQPRRHLVAPQRADRLAQRRDLAGRQRRQRRRQRAARLGLVAAEARDHQQVPRIPGAEDLVEQLQGRRVAPLQVLEHHHQRLLRARQPAQQLAEHPTKAVGPLDRRQRRHRRLRAEGERQLRQHVEQQPRLAGERHQQALAPRVQRLPRLRQRLTHQRLHPLRQRGVGRRLVEAATGPRRQLPAARRDLPLELAQQRRLADAGRPGDQDQPGRPDRARLVGRQQPRQRLAATDQQLGQLQALGPVL